MESTTNQLQESDSRKRKYRNFFRIVCLIIFGVLIFLGWSLTRGQGENNLGFWLIFVIIPNAIRETILFIGLSLILKVVFVKLFKSGWGQSILATFLVTLFVSLSAGYFLVPRLFVQESSYLFFFYWGIALIGSPALLISTLSYLFKVKQPDFWRLNLGPVIITYSLVMLVLPPIVNGWNAAFTKWMVCDPVIGRTHQLDCYRAKAIRTGDADLCVEKNLDFAMKGDCILDIAIFKKDISFCEHPVIKTNNKNYNLCLSEASNRTDEF